jgi:hypothetical protein
VTTPTMLKNTDDSFRSPARRPVHDCAHARIGVVLANEFFSKAVRSASRAEHIAAATLTRSSELLFYGVDIVLIILGYSDFANLCRLWLQTWILRAAQAIRRDR